MEKIIERFDILDLLDRSLLFSLSLFVFSIPLSESIKNIALGMTLFFWLCQVLINRNFRIKMYPLGWFHLFFLSASLLSAFLAFDVHQGFRGFWDIFRYFIVFLIIINNVDSDKKVKLLVSLFIISILVGGIWGIFESLKAPTDYLAELSIHSLGHQNHTATYLLIIFALVFGVVININAKFIFRLISLFSLIFIGFLILLTNSRTAMITLVFMLVAFIFAEKKWKILLISGLLLFCSFVGLFAFSSLNKTGSFGKKIISEYSSLANPLQDRFFQQRLGLWKRTLKLIEKNPVLGVGPRNFDLAMRGKDGHGASHAHNLFVNIGAEMGLVGLAAVLLWLLCYIYTWFKSKSILVTDLDKALWLSTLGAFITIVISGLATTTLHTEGAIAFVSVIGLMLVSLKIKRREIV